jgi:broad specificity phosphatase PhoE
LYSDGVRRAAFAIAALALIAATRPLSAQEAIYIVRHAERADQSADAALSTKGAARSDRLRDLLRDAGITHIFTTELRRTIDTATPLASALHLRPARVPADDTPALVTRLRALGAHDRALVVGHSNTVPAVLSALGVDAAITLGDSDYDNLFIVVLNAARPVLLRLRY